MSVTYPVTLQVKPGTFLEECLQKDLLPSDIRERNAKFARSESFFLQWLTEVDVVLGMDNERIFGGRFIVAMDYNSDVKLQDFLNRRVYKLSPLQITEFIQYNTMYIGSDDDPSKAMDSFMKKMRLYYFSTVSSIDKLSPSTSLSSS